MRPPRWWDQETSSSRIYARRREEIEGRSGTTTVQECPKYIAGTWCNEQQHTRMLFLPTICHVCGWVRDSSVVHDYIDATVVWCPDAELFFGWMRGIYYSDGKSSHTLYYNKSTPPHSSSILKQQRQQRGCRCRLPWNMAQQRAAAARSCLLIRRVRSSFHET